MRWSAQEDTFSVQVRKEKIQIYWLKLIELDFIWHLTQWLLRLIFPVTYCIVWDIYFLLGFIINSSDPEDK